MEFNCPCCKYKVVKDYCEGKKENDFITEGDELPINISFSNDIGLFIWKNSLFEDDIKASLIACPNVKSWRLGEVAYKTGGKEVVPEYRPLFAILKKVKSKNPKILITPFQ